MRIPLTQCGPLLSVESSRRASRRSISCVHSSPSDSSVAERNFGIGASPVSMISSIPRSGGRSGGASPSTSAYLALSAAKAGSSAPAQRPQTDARCTPLHGRNDHREGGCPAVPARPGTTGVAAPLASSMAASAAWSACAGRDHPFDSAPPCRSVHPGAMAATTAAPPSPRRIVADDRPEEVT